VSKIVPGYIICSVVRRIFLAERQNEGGIQADWEPTRTSGTDLLFFLGIRHHCSPMVALAINKQSGYQLEQKKG
jgi:hypothetical protein